MVFKNFKTIDEEEKREIFEMWNDGVTQLHTLADEFHHSTDVIVRALIEMGVDYEYISLAEAQYEVKRHNVKEVKRIFTPELCTFWKNRKGEYIPLYDVTDLYVDKPNICKIPEWKLELQRKGKVFFGY